MEGETWVFVKRTSEGGKEGVDHPNFRGPLDSRQRQMDGETRSDPRAMLCWIWVLCCREGLRRVPEGWVFR